MVGDVLKFRCYRCGKLLGAPAAKGGKATSCPNCRAELIIPGRDEGEGSGVPELARAIDYNASPRASTSTPPASAAGRDPGFSWEDIDTGIFQAAAAAIDIDSPITIVPRGTSPESSPALHPFNPTNLPQDSTPPPPALVEGATELPSATQSSSDILAIKIPGRIPPAAPAAESRRGTGEVVLSRGVVASGMAFALIAVGIAFLAGLVVVHYIWRAS